MSKYHPIDVRHPANRQYRNPDYLLEPPGPDVGSPLASAAPRAAASFARRPAQTAEPAAAPAAAPWGGSSARTGTDTFAPARTRGFPRLFQILIVLGVVGWVVSRETRLLDQAVLQLRIWAQELGLPF